MGIDIVPVCAKGRLQAPRLLAAIVHCRGGRASRISRGHGQVWRIYMMTLLLLGFWGVEEIPYSQKTLIGYRCNVGFKLMCLKVLNSCTYFQGVRHRLLLRHLTRPGHHLLQRKGDRLLKEEAGSGRDFQRLDSFYLWLIETSCIFNPVYLSI